MSKPLIAGMIAASLVHARTQQLEMLIEQTKGLPGVGTEVEHFIETQLAPEAIARAALEITLELVKAMPADW